MEAIVRTAAGMFDAAACSIALTDPTNGELVYEAAWGAGASEVVGMRLPTGVGIAGAVVASGDGVFVPECRKDPRFARQVAAGTGYVPYTMVVAPLVREGKTIGVLSVLDRRDGGPYLREDLARSCCSPTSLSSPWTWTRSRSPRAAAARFWPDRHASARLVNQWLTK